VHAVSSFLTATPLPEGIRQMPVIVDEPAPVHRFRLANRLAERALANAREGLAQIQVTIADRRALRPRLHSDSPETAPARSGDLVTLTRQECLRLLAGRSVGRLAFNGRIGVALILPVNYALNGDEILIRTGPGTKVQAAERREVVSLEIDEFDEAARTGWSVVVTGKCRISREALFDAAQPGSAPVARPVPWVAGPRSLVIRMAVTHVSGRRLAG
jgi:uncharacterized protein